MQQVEKSTSHTFLDAGATRRAGAVTAAASAAPVAHMSWEQLPLSGARQNMSNWQS